MSAKKTLSQQDIINELYQLEIYFEQGRKKAYSTRRKLELFSAPAPSGVSKKDKEMIAGFINKRNSQILKKVKQ
jgi:hypothetical protein